MKICYEVSKGNSCVSPRTSLLIFNTARKQSNLFPVPRQHSQRPHIFMLFLFFVEAAAPAATFAHSSWEEEVLRYRPHVQNQFLCYRQDERHKRELVCYGMAKEITNGCHLWDGRLILHPRNTGFLQRSKLRSVESYSWANIHVTLIRL